MQDTQKNSVWWQTGLHLIAAVALFLPMIFVAGVLVYIYDVMVQGYIGRSGDGIGFLLRGIQYFIAAVGSLLLPAFLLKRTNGQVVGAVWSTIYILAFALLIIGPALLGVGSPGFWEWLEIVATTAGMGVAGIGFTIGAFREGV
jgi:hypothetical protein